ncbi:hypothetical protein BOTBODRAFT_39849 [Botryobasidium botryosum FD-172 SS1]|uniref:Uncharacterized protein n=1 Tax=Botryobasidium botryosum (strain FD-172 SS1) TaxID=930990 RepID=A0A067LRY9_BOTB1|nr:hypothetical protein BOTBODRAFT_39849 [Botryobasidium botryosum FD-172 SS1]
MIFAALLALALAAPALAVPAVRGMPATGKLSAHAHVTGPKFNIDATFDIVGSYDGNPTQVTVKVNSGLTLDPNLGTGEYLYHIHTNPLDPSGNCTLAFAHLDPYNVTESITCDPNFKQYCQEGDFSGKWGKLKGTQSGAIDQFSFSDPFVRFFPQDASLLGRSIVIHSANKTRIACGNITSILDGTMSFSGQPTNKPSSFVTDFPSAAPAQPAILISPFNGTDLPSQTFLDALPYPISFPAIPLDKALNIEFFQHTHDVKVNNVQTTVTQPDAKAAYGYGPTFNW